MTPQALKIAEDFIKSYEGCRLTAYQDVGGTWTIGYGHTATARPDITITQENAQGLFDEDLRVTVNAMEKFIHVPVTDNQIAACASFCFNLGVRRFALSDLLHLLNMSDYAGAADQFPRYNHATLKNGSKVVVAGLTRRREAEKALFLKR